MTIRRFLLLLTLPLVAAAQSTIYSGDAAAVRANVLGIINASISDTGPLPSTGGSLSTTLLDLQVPPILSLNLLSGSTEGSDNRTNSQASVTNVTLDVAGVHLTASVLTSNATAFCSADTANDGGTSTIVDLKLNGLKVKVTGAPNQTINLLVATIVINEQLSSVNISSSGNSANMTVNALHVRALGVADVVISSSQAGVSCPGQVIIPQ